MLLRLFTTACFGLSLLCCVSSAQAARLLFESVTDTGGQLFSVNADGTNQKQLTFAGKTQAQSGSPQWNAKAGRIAFIRWEKGASGSQKTNIWTMKADGSDQTIVKGSTGVLHFAWRAQSGQFNLVRKQNGLYQLCYIDGGDYPQVILEEKWEINSLVFSPSGEWMAYTVASGPLFLIGAQGGSQRELTPHLPFSNEKGSVTDLAFSPTEPFLTFTWSPALSNARTIYRVQMDGSNFHQISKPGRTEVCAHWRADGRRLIFLAGRPNGIWIISMKPDGTDRRRHSIEPGYDCNPHFSPNGQRIAFYRDESPQQWYIWVMNTDGTNARRVSSTGRDYFSCWLPGRNRDALIPPPSTKDSQRQF